MNTGLGVTPNNRLQRRITAALRLPLRRRVRRHQKHSEKTQTMGGVG